MSKTDQPAGVAVDRGVRPHVRTVADHVEQRLRTWRQRHMNRSGDRLALVIASARSLPPLMLARPVLMFMKVASTWPPSRSRSAGAPPL